MTILINACCARYGGAKSIVQSYIDNYSGEEEVVLLAPDVYSISSERVKHIKISTNGLFTLLFSSVFIGIFILKFKARVVLSFTNINFLLPLCGRITYFHQLKIFEGRELRFRILRVVLKRFLLKSSFIFQTTFVRDSFIKYLGRPRKVYICWPGCNVEVSHVNEKALTPGFNALIPYIEITAKQKNFEFFKGKSSDLFRLCDDVYVPSKSYGNDLGFRFIGPQKKHELIALYEKTAVVLVASTVETVCLPIFEFASTGKPVIVIDAPYIRAISEAMCLPKNIVIVSRGMFTSVLEDVKNNYESYCEFDEGKLVGIKTRCWPEI